jgi:hypothetical protein
MSKVYLAAVSLATVLLQPHTRLEPCTPACTVQLCWRLQQFTCCTSLRACLQIGERFCCLALTLEMPFKDNANLVDAHVGWSPRRSMLLGGACIGAILDVAPRLRP